MPVTLSPTFSTGPGRALFENAAYRGAGAALSDRTYDVTPDGKRFLMLRDVDADPQRTLVVVQNWLDELTRQVPVR